MPLSTAHKILLCLRYGIGDLVMELPALDAVRAATPGAQLTAIGARPAIELLEGDRRIDTLLALQDFGLTHWGDGGTAQSWGEIRGWLRRENFDAVLDPSHAPPGLAEAIWKHGATIYDAGTEAQDRVLQAGRGGAAAVRASVAAGWGLPLPPSARPRIVGRPDELAFARRFLRQKGLGDIAPIGLSPVASSPLKRWPMARFAELVERLAAMTYAPLLLFYGPQEEIGAALQSMLRDRLPLVAVGALHLRAVAALLAACRLFIGHDTGLMHLAAAVGAPVVALFGPTSPDIYLPSQVPAVGVGGRDDCPWRTTWAFGPSKCLTEGGCLHDRRSCIDEVEVEQVLAAISSLDIEGRADRRRPSFRPG
ncbi:MAG: glycosyltransferase family 9 protein [Desulfuromonadales bacterium]|nr:glycosyltransferase family 9 protein [Desulfuromonadales bacterium]